MLVAHGWQDYNVKQEEGVALFEALREDDPADHAVEGVPFKRLYMFQDGHGEPQRRQLAPAARPLLRPHPAEESRTGSTPSPRS